MPLTALSRLSVSLIVLVGCADGKSGDDRDPTSAPTVGETVPVGLGTGATTVSGTTVPAEYGCYTLRQEPSGARTLVRVHDTDPTIEFIQGFAGSLDLEASIYDLAWFDQRWWACDDHVNWLDPIAATAVVTDIPCYSLVVDGTTLLIRHTNGLYDPWHRYASSQGILSRTSVGSFVAPWPLFTRAASLNGNLYTMIHSTDRMQVIGVANDVVREMPLEGFDTWTWGIAATDQGRIRILDDGRQDGMDYAVQVREFDANTGEETARIRVGTFPVLLFNGLWCGEYGP